MALLLHLSFKVSNNRFLWWRTSATALSFSAGKGLSFSLSLAVFEHSLPRRYAAILSLYVLHVSLHDSTTAAHFAVSVGGISERVGEEFCLAPHLSVAYLNHAHSCHPSHCPPNLSLSAVTRSKISLFHLARPCFTLFFRTKAHFSVCHPDDDWQGVFGLNSSKIFWKMNPDCAENRAQLHLTP